MELERLYHHQKLDLEASSLPDGANLPPTISGYAAVFDVLSEEMYPGVKYRIAPGAFKTAIGADSDVRALVNHDPNLLLARTKSGTLSLVEDDKGLRVKILPPNTVAGRDIVEMLRRGDIDQMSFGFSTRDEAWATEGDWKIRTIKDVELFDVSVVTFPAFPQTFAEALSAVPFASGGAKVDEASPWDAAAALDRVRRWASSDGSGGKDAMDWAKYRKAFAWYDPENAEDFGAYKLPHHDILNDQLAHHWRGTAAAMGVMLGSRGGVDIPAGDRRGVYNHLAAEYRLWDKEVPPFSDASSLAYMGRQLRCHRLEP